MDRVPSDFIHINNLLLNVPLNSGAYWQSDLNLPVLQPIHVSLSISTDISATAITDDLAHSIDYSEICTLLLRNLTIPHELTQGQLLGAGLTLESLADTIFRLCFSNIPKIQVLGVKLTQAKSPLHCKALRIEAFRSRNEVRIGTDRISVDGLECDMIIGVDQCEREEKQIVRFDVEVEHNVDASQPLDFRALTRYLYSVLSGTSYLTLEALASRAARTTLIYIQSTSPLATAAAVTIRAYKPSALVFADSAEVHIKRTLADYPASTSSLQPGYESIQSKVAIALGSNLGDRFFNIEYALRLLEEPSRFPDAYDAPADQVKVDIIDTSFLYESPPMYVEDQPSFVNCACLIETNLRSLELLRVLKNIESEVGRVPSIRNGPRAIDLDIILFDNEIIDTRPTEDRVTDASLTGQLVVPHPQMAEREFVLRPLSDMIPTNVHPVLHRSISALLSSLPPSKEPLKRVIPFPRHPSPTASEDILPPSTHSNWGYAIDGLHIKTRLMATLNVTPDSFSDGSLHDKVEAAVGYAHASILGGADIIDIGGYSTRPNAQFVSIEDETDRVVRTVTGIRHAEHPPLKNVLISVDTFRPEVARAAILAGANCINDVYAFTGNDSYPFNPDTSSEAMKGLQEMKTVARELAVPVILMHSRGDAGSNKDYSAYAYAGSRGAEVVEGVMVELGRKVDTIVQGKGGIRRWMIIADPGVGFSKTVVGNLAVIKRAKDIVADANIGEDKSLHNPLSGFPLLIGSSRKSFLGVILEEKQEGRKTDPKERGWATAATVACAVNQGVLVVRVHDVEEMRDVVCIAESLRD